MQYTECHSSFVFVLVTTNGRIIYINRNTLSILQQWYAGKKTKIVNKVRQTSAIWGSFRASTHGNANPVVNKPPDRNWTAFPSVLNCWRMLYGNKSCKMIATQKNEPNWFLAHDTLQTLQFVGEGTSPPHSPPLSTPSPPRLSTAPLRRTHCFILANDRCHRPK